MTDDKGFGPHDSTHHDHLTTSIDPHAGHETGSSSAQPGHAGRGHGHHWMMMACCVPMLVIAVALVATGTAGAGTIVWAIGCTLLMALMMGGMGGHGHGGGDRQ